MLGEAIWSLKRQNWSTEMAKKCNFRGFFELFSKRARWKLLIFASNVVLTFPDHLARLDWMYHFIEGYLEKSYGVRPSSSCELEGREVNAKAGRGRGRGRYLCQHHHRRTLPPWAQTLSRHRDRPFTFRPRRIEVSLPKETINSCSCPVSWDRRPCVGRDFSAAAILIFLAGLGERKDH